MASIIAREEHIGKDIRLGPNVLIKANKLFIGDGAIISNDVQIIADNVYIGYGVVIGEGAILGFKELETGTEIKIGDYTTIDRNVRVSVPLFSVGDYGIIHEEVVFYGSKRVDIGHNCWIGQWSVINSKDKVSIGNNFRMGLQSQIWTHVASGELIEGCNIYSVAPITIEDDVWLVGHVIVSPGVRICNRTIVLAGSLVNRDTVPSHCYAGLPAKDITNKLIPYREVSLEEKFIMIDKWIGEFIALHPEMEKHIKIEREIENVQDEEDLVVFTTSVYMLKKTFEKTSLFDIQTKKYTKRRSRAEREIIEYLRGHKARFLPMEE